MPVKNLNKFDDVNVENLSTKLSLDSKTKNETANEIVDIKSEFMRVSLPSKKNMKTESFTNVSKQKILKEEACGENVISCNQDLGMEFETSMRY